MARIAIPVTTLSRAGVAPPAQTDADSTKLHTLVNNGQTVVEIVSSDGSSRTVDVTFASASVDGVSVPPKTITIPAGATRVTGPWPTDLYNQAAVAADALLTSDATAPTNGDTVVVAGQTYTFKTALTPAANEVLIGANAAAAISNLKQAINADTGAGTLYGAATGLNAYVTATTLTSTTLLVVAKTAGTGGNALAVTETSTHLSWSGATLTGGYDSGAVIFLAPSVSTTLKFRAYSLV